ncbi:hypothetical protein BJ138DRAFT_1119396 [Hygrophoropsis aurantiaca]|uniref:Uncharacterized protein n=1 Tax=Hygrophoropsis aurantiaca TaxID=72124 RepID=A0ACB7ZUB9_9AGAM|nr:hypothetical protein BJ138DRAFT_1119396 [Hygrophoropsis aurantiaca]
MACVSKILIQKSRAVAGEHAHGPAIVPAEVITGPGPGDRINCFSTKGSKHFAKINNIDALFRVAVKSKKLTQYQQAVYRRMIRMVLSDERSANHREKLTSLVLTKEQEIGRLQNQIAEDRAKTDLACQSARVQRNNVRRRHKALVTAKDDDICRLQTQIADDREKANRAHKDSRGRIARYKTQLAEKDDEIYQLQTQIADDREKANRAHKDSRVRIASYKTQLAELGQEIRRLEQQIANDGAKAIRALDTAEIQSNREKKAQKEFLDLCHDILMLGKDQEIARLKKRIAEGQKAAEQLAEANAAQHSEILRQQIEIQELKDALANADVLHEANSAQHTMTLHAREAEIERLFAMQPQFMNELVDQNDKIASQANELARFVDIVRDQKATISTLESSLVIREKEIARTEKCLKLEMKVTEELYARIVRLEDRPSLFRYNKWIILWLEMSLANRQKVIARFRDFLDKERSELGRLENDRRVDLAQHAKELCDRDADIMRLCAMQTQLIIELADQNVEIANLTSELAKVPNDI